LLWGLRRGGSHGILDDAELVGDGGGPGLLAAGGGRFLDEAFERSGCGDVVGGLVFGTQPPDEPRGLLGSAFGVESDDTFEDLLGGEVVRPAVGGEDGMI